VHVSTPIPLERPETQLQKNLFKVSIYNYECRVPINRPHDRTALQRAKAGTQTAPLPIPTARQCLHNAHSSQHAPHHWTSLPFTPCRISFGGRGAGTIFLLVGQPPPPSLPPPCPPLPLEVGPP